MQAPHGKIETLCYGAQVVDALVQDNAPPGMTTLEWCQAQAKGPAIHQIVGGNSKTNFRNIKDQDGDAFRFEGNFQN